MFRHPCISVLARALTAMAAMLICCVASADSDDVQAASDIASEFSNYAGSAESIQQKLTQPLMSGTAMEGPDGKQFDAQVSCQSEDAFLDVFIIPSATGDISSINVKVDTTMDGLHDSTYVSPMHASGVCANGVITCNPGTWEDCQGYKWSADFTNHLQLVEAAPSELGGCYCVNNHCGSGLLVNNLEATVSALGGGAAGALTSLSPYYAITRTQIDGPTAQYFGQNVADCGMPGLVASTSYMNDSSNFTNDAASSAASNPTYQLFSQSPSLTASDLSSVSCELNRSVNLSEIELSEIIDYSGGAGDVGLCGPDCLQLTLGQVGDDYWGPYVCGMETHDVQFNVMQPDRIMSATLTNVVWDDWIQVKANSNQIFSGPHEWIGVGNPPGTCEQGTNWNVNPNIDFTSVLQAGGLVDFNIRVAISGGGEGYARAEVMVETGCAIEPDIVSDGCTAYEADTSCTLIEETVDGVETITGGLNTGLVPLSSDRTLSGSACSETVNRSWWKKERKYSCISNSGPTPTFDEGLERLATIHGSASPTSYDDLQFDPNNPGAPPTSISNLQIELLDEVPVASCSQACKTSRIRPRNDVSESGVVTDLATNPVTREFIYRDCPQSNVCPIGPGETLETDCSCISNFGEAASIMQLIRLGGQDVICSSGFQQPIQ